MKKALGITKRILVWLVVAVAVLMMIFTVISSTTFNRSDRHIFGYRAYIVLTDSMAATDFDAGDLVLVKQTDIHTLRPGDIITFVSQDSESFGNIVTHKIRKVTRDAQGELAFVTYGTTTGTDDATLVTGPYILGKYEFAIPKLGMFFNFLKTPQGYILCIFLPFMLLIVYQGLNCVQLFRRYKGEQMGQMAEERARLEEERLANAKMLEELQALKAQLEGKMEDNEAVSNEIEKSEANV